MGVNVQTRFDTALNGGISDVAVIATLAASPAFTTGYGTFERGEANEEDIYWGGVSGLQLTGMLRGLSKTALTNTEVAGNKKPHLDGVQFEGTLLHYIVNDKASKSSNESITGLWDFNVTLPTSTVTPSADADLTTKVYADTADALKGNLSGGNVWAGTQTFEDDEARSTTNAAPVDGKSFTNKDYVDGQIAAIGDSNVAATATDTTPGNLEDKLTGGTHVSFTTNDPAGDEDRQIDLDAIQATTGLAQADNLIASNDRGHLDPSFLGNTLTTVEAIDGSTTPQAVTILGKNYKEHLIINASGELFFSTNTGNQRNFGDIDARTRNGQSFVITDALADEITLENLIILLDKTGNPLDNVTIEIQTDDGGGAPDGVVIGNGTSNTVSGITMSADEQPVKFTWATPPILASGTTYWAIISRSDINDAANFYMMRDANASTYAGGTGSVYAASIPTWTDIAEDFQMIFLFNLDYDGKIASADANSLKFAKFDGFTESDVGASAFAEVLTTHVVDSFPSLNRGAPYYLDTVAGGITPIFPTPGTGIADTNGIIAKVGTAFSDTRLKVEKEFIRVLSLANIYSAARPIYAGASAADFDVFVPCGFSPMEFEIRYQRTNVANSAADDRHVTTRYIGTTEVANWWIEDLTNQQTQPAVSTFKVDSDGAVSIAAIYENGYLLNISTTHTAELLTGLIIIAKA